ncbi:MAG TPA: hypothetical protein VH917_01505 [Ignavibacteriaceae bacterium]
MNITDEILNEYLDGELTAAEIIQVESAISSSEEIRKKLNALKLVHSQLFKLNEEKVSEHFTEHLMKKLPHKLKAPLQQRVFIASMSLFIVTICVLIIGYIASLAASSVPQVSEFNVLKSLGNFAEGFVLQTEKFFGAKGLSILGSVFSFIIIISGYFFFENQKRLKSNLGR